MPTWRIRTARRTRASQQARWAGAADREVAVLVALGRLARDVAHEINNPLAGIGNAFLLVRAAIPPTHPFHGYLQSIDRELARMTRATRVLLAAYPFDLVAHGAAPGRVVEEVVGAVCATIDAREVEVSVQLRAEHAPLVAPAGLLRHGVFTLLRQALMAADAGDRVVIRDRRVDGGYELEVALQRGGVAADAAAAQAERPTDPVSSPRVRTARLFAVDVPALQRAMVAVGGALRTTSTASETSCCTLRFPLAGASHVAS